MNAAVEIEQRQHPEKTVEPAGIFYYQVKDPLTEGSLADTQEKIQEKLLALLRTVRGGLRLLFKGIWVTVWIRWPIQAEDAARTALLYGKANAWIGGAAAVLAHLFQFRLRQLGLAPDFLGDKQGRGEVSCRITASLPVLAAAPVWTLVPLKKQKGL